MLTHHRREFHYWPPPPQSQILICCEPIIFRKLFLFFLPLIFPDASLSKSKRKITWVPLSGLFSLCKNQVKSFFFDKVLKNLMIRMLIHFWLFWCKKQTFCSHFNQIWFTSFGVIFLLLAAMYCYVGSGENLCTVQRWNLKCKPGDEWAQWRI